MNPSFGKNKGCPNVSDAEYLERLKKRLVVSTSGCWEIQGFRHKEGYGEMCYRGKNVRAHKLMYMLAVKPIQDGLCVLHRCDNPPCCNPEHLWLGTRGDNIRDAASKGRHQEQQKTHCPRGHAYDEVNTGYHPNGARTCKMCCRGRQRVKSGWSPDEAYSLPPIPFNQATERRKFGRRTRQPLPEQS